MRAPIERPQIHKSHKSIKRLLMRIAGGVTVLVVLLGIYPPKSGIALYSDQGCQLDYMGLIPLTDLGTGTYNGFEGGLYPGGVNIRPVKYERMGLDAAAQVVPLDPAGNPDSTNGKIVLISIGMSNATYEFASGRPGTPFKAKADADPAKNPRLVIVDGAQSGRTAEDWIDINSPVWQVVFDRLAAAGVTMDQVEVAWVKQANPQPQHLGPFPGRMQILEGQLELIAQNIKAYFPRIKLVFFSNRTRSYRTTDDPNSGFLNPEPMAYENGFAVKWLVEKYIKDVNFRRTVPYLTWGPYLWTDGLGPDHIIGGIPGRSDGMEWTCIQGQNYISDVRTDDYTHPGKGGIDKVADILLNFFKTDRLSTSWFLASK